ncbi:hypothetical protein ACOI9X_15830 [Pseudomonas sp. P2757]|uniref:hypothetical protein n=1 Tax=unclassified Pseudomonas TaxID=196821 RepID=UPI003B5C44B3
MTSRAPFKENKVFSDSNIISALTADDPSTEMALKTTRWLKNRAYDYAYDNGWSPTKFDAIAELTDDEWLTYRKIWRQAIGNTPWIRNIQRSETTISAEIKNADFLMLISALADKETAISLHIKKLLEFIILLKERTGAQSMLNSFFSHATEDNRTANTILMPIVRSHGVLNGSIISLGINSKEAGWMLKLKNNFLGAKLDVQVKFQFIVYDYYDDVWESKGVNATSKTDMNNMQIFDFL